LGFVLWVAAAPFWLSGFIVIVVPTALAMLGPVLVRRFVMLERLTTNNEVAGFKFAVLGVVYAVLLGFAVIVVWEKFHDAEAAVAQEAGASLALARLAGGLPQGSQPGQGGALRARVSAYLHAAIEQDWPAAARAKLNPAATQALNELYRTVLGDRPEDPDGGALQSEMLHQLDQLTQARRARLMLSQGVVPGVVWTVLALGAVVTVGFTFFFGTINLRAQVLMTGLLALIIFLGLEVIVTVNRPFTGPVSVGSHPLEDVLNEIQRAS
jgi:Protein of unknown function (DUF4239)